GIDATASLGVAWLMSKVPPRGRRSVALVATLLVLVEFWPVPWPQETLRRVPAFYRQIANDPETYGVFDLPIRPLRPIDYRSSHVVDSSHYQVEQMTHHKGIASGYIDRAVLRHPVFAPLGADSSDDGPEQNDLRIDGKPASRYANAQYELARNGYRYVVFHKPQPEYDDYVPGSWGEATAREFLRSVFRDQRPLVDDELVTVYRVDPSLDLARRSPSILPRVSDEQAVTDLQPGKHWAFSPAGFQIVSPSAVSARLEITPEAIYDPASNAFPAEVAIRLEPETGPAVRGVLRAGQTTVLPLSLTAGSQVVRLRFPPRSGRRPGPGLRFSIRSINLAFGDSVSHPNL